MGDRNEFYNRRMRGQPTSSRSEFYDTLAIFAQLPLEMKMYYTGNAYFDDKWHYLSSVVFNGYTADCDSAYMILNEVEREVVVGYHTIMFVVESVQAMRETSDAI